MKTHFWPFVSSWNNGAGRRQVQVLSPLEVFFPHNEHIRHSWSPFFALYRYDQPATGESRHSLLWDAVTYRRNEAAGTRRLQVGPIFGTQSGPLSRRISVLNGLFGWQRDAHSRWRFFIRGGSPAIAADSVSPP